MEIDDDVMIIDPPRTVKRERDPNDNVSAAPKRARKGAPPPPPPPPPVSDLALVPTRAAPLPISDEAPYIPDEIWTIMFNYLHESKARMRGRCVQVCQQWHRLWSSDFSTLVCYKIRDFYLEPSLSMNSIFADPTIIKKLQIHPTKGKLLGYLAAPKDTTPVGWCCLTTHGRALIEYMGRVVHLPQPATALLKPEFSVGGHRHIDLTIKINYRHLQKGRGSTGVVEFLHDMTGMIRRSARTQCYGINTRESIPIWASIVLQQPSLIRITMHRYQLEAMSWIHWVEKNPRTIECYQHAPIPFSVHYPHDAIAMEKKIVTFDVSHTVPTLVQQNNVAGRFTVCGGVFADEVGLGKTLTLIASSLVARPATPLALYSDNDIGEGTERFPTRGTLIIVPNTLYAQWLAEIDKCVGKEKLRVIGLSTKPEHERVTYRDMMQADFVVVTAQFLTNVKHYARLLDKAASGYSSITDTPSFRLEMADAVCMSMRDEYHALTSGKTCPLLEVFQWQRLIVDEAPQVLERASPFIFALSANARWFVSGTPFPKEEVMEKLTRFFQLDVAFDDMMTRFKAPGESFVRDQCWTVVHDTFMRNFIQQSVWRNTKASVRDMLVVPAVTPVYVPIEYLPIERLAYICRLNHEGQRLFCAKPHCPRTLVSSTKTNVKRDRDETEKSADRSYALVLEQAERLGEELDKVGIDRSGMDMMTVTWNELEPVAVAANHFIFPKHVVTMRDGHSKQHQEAVHRLLIYSDVLAQLEHVHEEDYINATTTLEEIRFEHGSKVYGVIAHLQYLLAANPDYRILIFSREEKLLERIREICAQLLIGIVVLGSNVMCKTKALRDFRAAQSKTRVMLLNSSANAAGTNLIEATHVLLVDPAEGKATERHATEQQAIGRAYRQGQKKSIEVVRFYIKDTVEHDIVNELIETKKR